MELHLVKVLSYIVKVIRCIRRFEMISTISRKRYVGTFFSAGQNLTYWAYS